MIYSFHDRLLVLHLTDGTLGVATFIFYIAVPSWFPHSLVKVSSVLVMNLYGLLVGHFILYVLPCQCFQVHVHKQPILH